MWASLGLGALRAILGLSGPLWASGGPLWAWFGLLFGNVGNSKNPPSGQVISFTLRLRILSPVSVVSYKLRMSNLRPANVLHACAHHELPMCLYEHTLVDEIAPREGAPAPRMCDCLGVFSTTPSESS